MAPRRASEVHKRGSAAARANEPTMDRAPPATIELSRPTSADAMPASSAPLADRAAARLRRRVSRGARPYRLGSCTSPGRRPAFSRAPPSQADPRTGRSRFRCGRRQASPAARRGLSQRSTTRLDSPRASAFAGRRRSASISWRHTSGSTTGRSANRLDAITRCIGGTSASVGSSTGRSLDAVAIAIREHEQRGEVSDVRIRAIASRHERHCWCQAIAIARPAAGRP